MPNKLFPERVGSRHVRSQAPHQRHEQELSFNRVRQRHVLNAVLDRGPFVTNCRDHFIGDNDRPAR